MEQSVSRMQNHLSTIFSVRVIRSVWNAGVPLYVVLFVVMVAVPAFFQMNFQLKNNLYSNRSPLSKALLVTGH